MTGNSSKTVFLVTGFNFFFINWMLTINCLMKNISPLFIYRMSFFIMKRGITFIKWLAKKIPHFIFIIYHYRTAKILPAFGEERRGITFPVQFNGKADFSRCFPRAIFLCLLSKRKPTKQPVAQQFYLFYVSPSPRNVLSFPFTIQIVR